MGDARSARAEDGAIKNASRGGTITRVWSKEFDARGWNRNRVGRGEDAKYSRSLILANNSSARIFCKLPKILLFTNV